MSKMLDIFDSEESNTTYTYSRSVEVKDDPPSEEPGTTLVIANSEFPFNGACYFIKKMMFLRA
jgi:hypothetical protein